MFVLIEKKLGAGGMGVVYLARQPSEDRLVALKVMALTEDIGPGWRLVRRRGDLETSTWRLRHDGTETATLHLEYGPGRTLGWAVRLTDGTPLPDDAPTPGVPDGSWLRLRRLSAAAAAWLQSQPGLG